MMEFWGYRRPDGKVGVRNHVLVIATVGCAGEVARKVSENVAGTVSFVSHGGCAEAEQNLAETKAVLLGMHANPNIYGTVAIGLGCEANNMDAFLKLAKERTCKPIVGFTIQDLGGSINTIAAATRAAEEMVIEASECLRELCPLSELTLGIECGGSDATSGLVSNPVMGRVSDKLVEMGGTAMFSETIEMIGAEHLLAQRAATPEVAQRILERTHKREMEQADRGEDIRKAQPSPGNKAGGITTLEEKSLGCIHKGGHTPVVEMCDCAQTPTKKGLVLMDSPCFDLLSVTAKIAGGCQVVVFTTGRGNTIGNPVAPVIKVTANGDTFRHLKDNIDMDMSAVTRGELGLNEEADITLQEIIKVMSGKLTKAEVHKFGYAETVTSRPCEYI